MGAKEELDALLPEYEGNPKPGFRKGVQDLGKVCHPRKNGTFSRQYIMHGDGEFRRATLRDRPKSTGSLFIFAEKCWPR